MAWGQIIGAGAAVMTAMVTGVFAYFGTRSRARIDLSSSITAGFQQLTDQLQEERKDMMAIIHEQRAKIETQQKWMRHLEGHIQRLEWHASELERLMMDAGMTPPVLRLEDYTGGMQAPNAG